MKDEKQTKFVTEHEVQDSGKNVKPPFQLSEHNRRQFIRVEIVSPLFIQRIKSVKGDFWPEGQGQPVEGSIVNLSLGGVLIDLDDLFSPGDIVALRFNLQGEVIVENVLGLVKRSDESEGKYLTGIEFVDRNKLEDILSEAELNLLPLEFSGFDISVKKTLRKYVTEK